MLCVFILFYRYGMSIYMYVSRLIILSNKIVDNYCAHIDILKIANIDWLYFFWKFY